MVPGALPRAILLRPFRAWEGVLRGIEFGDCKREARRTRASSPGLPDQDGLATSARTRAFQPWVTRPRWSGLGSPSCTRQKPLGTPSCTRHTLLLSLKVPPLQGLVGVGAWSPGRCSGLFCCALSGLGRVCFAEAAFGIPVSYRPIFRGPISPLSPLRPSPILRPTIRI
jgi:hypothetical protein